MLRKVHPNFVSRNEMDLPLFAWAGRQAERLSEPAAPPVPWQVRAIARQTGLPVSRARLVAELAGFSTCDEAAGQ